MRNRFVALVLMAVTATMTVTGCSKADEAAPQTAGVVSIGQFDDLPTPPGSQPTAPASETGSAMAKSYLVGSGLPPEDVLRFYERELPPRGWEVLEAPAAGDKGVWRGDWGRDGHRLEVVAMLVSTDTGPDVPEVATTQLSLVLNETLADNPVYTAVTPPVSTAG